MTTICNIQLREAREYMSWNIDKNNNGKDTSLICRATSNDHQKILIHVHKFIKRCDRQSATQRFEEFDPQKNDKLISRFRYLHMTNYWLAGSKVTKK